MEFPIKYETSYTHRKSSFFLPRPQFVVIISTVGKLCTWMWPYLREERWYNFAVWWDFDTTSGLVFLGTGNRWRNAVLNYVYTYEIFVFSTVTPSRGHSLDPRQAVHLSIALFERGEMIQFCGVVRLWYHFRFGFSMGQSTGDGMQL